MSLEKKVLGRSCCILGAPYLKKKHALNIKSHSHLLWSGQPLHFPIFDFKNKHFVTRKLLLARSLRNGLYIFFDMIHAKASGPCKRRPHGGRGAPGRARPAGRLRSAARGAAAVILHQLLHPRHPPARGRPHGSAPSPPLPSFLRSVIHKREEGAVPQTQGAARTSPPPANEPRRGGLPQGPVGLPDFFRVPYLE